MPHEHRTAVGLWHIEVEGGPKQGPGKHTMTVTEEAGMLTALRGHVVPPN